MSRSPETPTEVAFSPPPKKYKTSQSHYDGPVEQTPLRHPIATRSFSDGVPTVHESQHKKGTPLYKALLKTSEEANEEANEEVKGRLSFSPRKGRQRGIKRPIEGGKTKRLAKNKPVIYMAKTNRRSNRRHSNRRHSNRRRNNTRRMRKIRGGGDLTGQELLRLYIMMLFFTQKPKHDPQSQITLEGELQSYTTIINDTDNVLKKQTETNIPFSIEAAFISIGKQIKKDPCIEYINQLIQVIDFLANNIQPK